MSSWRELIAGAAVELDNAGVTEARLDAGLLAMFVSGRDRTFFVIHGKEEAEDALAAEYKTLVARRAAREPLQYITGEQEFMGFTFRTAPGVLIPRQDTETLVEEGVRQAAELQTARGINAAGGELAAVFRKNPDGQPGPGEISILDMCTGTGAIGISCGLLIPNSHITACDIDMTALALATENAGLNNLPAARFRPLRSDMFTSLPASDLNSFDFILSNPPYIRTSEISGLMPEVRDHEPALALDGGRDGLDFYRILAEESPKWLKQDGWLIMEIGHDQGRDLVQLLEAAGKYQKISVIKDLPGNDRVVKAQLKKIYV